MRAESFFRFFIDGALALGIFIAAASCVPPRWHRIQPGMSKKDVIHFAGEPRKRSYDGDFVKGSGETWYYDYSEPKTNAFDPHRIRFRDGRVTSCEKDPERIAEIRHDQAPLLKNND